jgi:leucine dehydrogenase
MFTSRLQIEGYEEVYQFLDDGFRAFISIHSTKLGPALGGCRIREYETDDDALKDVLRLSKGMTYKNAAANLKYGGGKCVVNAKAASRDIMLKVGEIVNFFNGKYITGEDVGTTVDDMKIASEITPYVLSLGSAGDPSPWTGLGVYSCIKSVCNIMYAQNMKISVWVQGLGKVGWNLCNRLYKDGRFKLYVSDIRNELVEKAITEFGAIAYEDNFLYDVDIYSPCALGNVITQENIKNWSIPIICGSANNQLESDNLAEKLLEKNILYCPDFIVNSGGVIAASAELTGFNEDEVKKKINHIGDVLIQTIFLGTVSKKSPLHGAEILALSKM